MEESSSVRGDVRENAFGDSARLEIGDTMNGRKGKRFVMHVMNSDDSASIALGRIWNWDFGKWESALSRL